jgi:hypothetical protein
MVNGKMLKMITSQRLSPELSLISLGSGYFFEELKLMYLVSEW